jgi:sterol carrier protein 2
MARVSIAGVGMTDFRTPSTQAPYQASGAAAARAALADAGLDYADIDLVVAGYCMGDTCSGQTVAYQLGLTGVPVVNTTNACASGSAALYLARQTILSGEARSVLVVGFEEMGRTLQMGWPEKLSPVGWIDDRTRALRGEDANVSTTGWFAGAASEYLNRTGYGPEVLAAIGVKARRHAHDNPHAAFRDLVTLEEVMASKMIVDPLTKFECSAPASGAAAAVLTSERFAREKGLGSGVFLVAQAMGTDAPSAQQSDSMINLVGYDMAKTTADLLYERAGVGPEDIDVVELHDCFASNELLSYEALGLAGENEGGRMALDGDNTHGGRYLVNPSGGLIGKGHPIGATGVAQCVELTHQLRGTAGLRQRPGARTALQHNLGLGGACVVGLYVRD